MNKKAKPIPEGFHTLTPFLVVKDAARALKFYQDAFGAKEIEKHLGPDGKIVHALMKIGDSCFMLADEFPQYGSGVLSPSTLKGTTSVMHLYFENVDPAFNQAVKAGAKVKMPLDDMFWGDR